MVEVFPLPPSREETYRSMLLDCHLAAFTIREAAADGRMDLAYEHAAALVDRLTGVLGTWGNPKEITQTTQGGR